MLNFESFSDDEEGLHAYMPANRWNDSLLTDIRQRLTSHRDAGTIPSFTLSVRDVMPQNWQEQWERTITPVYAGKNVVIHPSWLPVEKTNDTIDIIIDPKMSFGTGHHETTQMMVELIEEYSKPGMNVLDVGTGSGVLAIVAAKMKAAYVVGIDNDPDAVIDARENCSLNKVDGTVNVFTGNLNEVDEIAGRSFDIIFANIERKTILNLLNPLIDLLNKDGILLLSGLLEEDYAYVEEECAKKKLNIFNTLRKTSQTSDTWLAIALKK